MYNIRKGVAGVNSCIEYRDFALDDPELLQFSQNKELSKELIYKIVLIKAEVSLACAVEGLPCPVISGGVIRDIMQGVRPKDIDVFVHVPEAAEDDIITDYDKFELVSYDLSNYPNYDRIKVEANREYEKDLQKYFTIADFFAHDETIQFIGKKDENLVGDNPLLHASDYPYNLVKNAFFGDTIRVSNEAWEGFEKKEVLFYNEKGSTKAYKWLKRHSLAKIGFTPSNPCAEVGLTGKALSYGKHYYRHFPREDVLPENDAIAQQQADAAIVRQMYAQIRQELDMERIVRMWDDDFFRGAQREFPNEPIAAAPAVQPGPPRNQGWQAERLEDIHNRNDQRNAARGRMVNQYVEARRARNAAERGE